MNVSSVKADLALNERAAFEACYLAMCHGLVAESRARALEWRDAKKALIAGC